MDRPSKITAKVAPYLDAIRRARDGGWGWREIGERVAPGANSDAVRAATKSCRYRVEQLPLPEVPAQRPAFAEGNTSNVQKRVLPRVGQKQKVVDGDDDGLTAAQRVLANIPKIGG